MRAATRPAPPIEKEARTSEERAYYAQNRLAWAVLAPVYDAMTWGWRDLRTEVVERAGIEPDARLLDVATGTGAQAAAFAARVREVVGLDLSEAMLRVARRKRQLANLTFRQGDATALPFGDASFDATCISFALHEMPAGIRQRTLAEMARVTRRGGRLVIVDYGRPPGTFGAAVYHLVRLYEGHRYADFMRSDLRALVERAGFDVQDDRAVRRGTVRILLGSRRV